MIPGARPPLLGPEPTPVPTATAPPAAAPTTPPVGVEPPPAPIPPPGESAATPPVPVPVPGEAGTPPAPPPPPAPLPPASGAPAAAPPSGAPVAVLFSPPEVSVKAGEMAAVSVVVLRVKDLLSVDVAVRFDPAAVESLDMEPGSLLTLDGSTVGSEKNIESTGVRARFTRPAPTSGSGAIATLRFRAKTPGQTPVTIETLSLTTAQGAENAAVPNPGRLVVLP